MSKGHHNNAWAKLSRQRREIARVNDECCEVCRRPFDWSLHSNNRMGCTVSHPEAIGLGAELLVPIDLLGVRHRACHGSEGSAISNLKQGVGPGSRGGDPEGYRPESHRSRSKQRRLTLVTDPAVDASTSSTRSPSKYDPDLDSSSSSSKVTDRGSLITQSNTPPPGLRVPTKINYDPYSPPRIESPPSPDVAGTLADEWTIWLGEGVGIELRPWQKHVLERALEVDSAGRLIWDEVCVSTGRQAGKSILIKALAIARCHYADYFGEPQQVGHLSNNLVSAKRIMRQSYRWAGDNDVQVRQAQGDERLTWPDGSQWFLSSMKAVWGSSAHLAMCDEIWDVAPAEIWEGVYPITIERDQSQLWMLSTANEEATTTYSEYRKKVGAGHPRALLLEWSADPDSDLADPEVWRLASPHWSEKRHQAIAAAPAKARRHQMLNIWPGTGSASVHWLAGWDGLGHSQGSMSGCVGAVEVASDRSCVGAAVSCLRDDGSIDVQTFTGPDLPGALAWLTEKAPWLVLAGVSIKAEVEGAGFWMTRPAGVKESGLSTPWLMAAVRNRMVRHEHREEVALEVSRSAVSDTEGGSLLSARRSAGPIPTIKSIGWSGWIAATEPVSMPAIW